MFYPSDSLKRGGRFYLCWVADSWPLRFATITQKQLWSRDIRKICDDLLEVINNESGRPTNRFSLRLSSQLMRGLVRIYQRKVAAILSETCRINAQVFHHTNRKQESKSSPSSPNAKDRQLRTLPLVAVVIQEETENEERVEEIIQKSGNVVMNIQDITLREETIPEFRLPPNDGFGEENQEQAMNLIVDRTMEMMMMPTDASVAQHSGLDLPGLDSTDKSHDKSRLIPQDLQMERISEHEVSMFRKSDGAGLLPTADFEKEIPEVPDVSIPELPQLQEKIQEVEAPEVVPKTPEVVPKTLEVRPETVETVALAPRPEEMELEELEELQPKRRKARKLIIDRSIKISSNTMRARVDDIHVELRCEESLDDIIEIRVPNSVLIRRPCCSGARFHSKISSEITRMFLRNLGVYRATSTEREIEGAALRRALAHKTVSDRIEEIDEPQMPQAKDHEMGITTLNLTQNITASNVTINVTQEGPKEANNSSKENVPEPEDIADLPTQKIETLSEQQRKRASVRETVVSPKRARSMGYSSFRESQREKEKQQAMEHTAMEHTAMEHTAMVHRAMEQTAMEVDIHPPPVIIEEPTPPPQPEFTDLDKENIPQNYQKPRQKDNEKDVTAMLQQAGIAESVIKSPLQQETKIQRQSQNGGEDSETPLGSLDRTKVSLGDSEETTDSKRFIRDQWGTEGTMIKILRMIKKGTVPVTVENLIAKGPVLAQYKNFIKARCFVSILKLKQYGFVIIKKNPQTLEIMDIRLGRKFD